MQRILILGGGGFGCELYSYINSNIKSGYLPVNLTLEVLDDNPQCEFTKKFSTVKYSGTIANYNPLNDEGAVIAIGNTLIRKKLAKVLKNKNISLLTYIHPSALIMPDAIIGNGSIICPNTIINTGVHIGENVAVNVFCSIGHGAYIGDHSVLSPYSAMSGDSRLGECSFMGTRATLFPGVSMGTGGIVDSHSVVKKTVGDNMIVSNRSEYLVLKNRMRTM